MGHGNQVVFRDAPTPRNAHRRLVRHQRLVCNDRLIHSSGAIHMYVGIYARGIFARDGRREGLQSDDAAREEEEQEGVQGGGEWGS